METVQRENLAIAYGEAATHATIHTADPGTTGANEVAGAGRQAVTWTAGAVDGQVTATVVFTVASGVRVLWVVLWNASTGGNILQKKAIDVTSTGTVTLNMTYTQNAA